MPWCRAPWPGTAAGSAPGRSWTAACWRTTRRSVAPHAASSTRSGPGRGAAPAACGNGSARRGCRRAAAPPHGAGPGAALTTAAGRRSARDGREDLPGPPRLAPGLPGRRAAPGSLLLMPLGRPRVLDHIHRGLAACSSPRLTVVPTSSPTPAYERRSARPAPTCDVGRLAAELGGHLSTYEPSDWLLMVDPRCCPGGGPRAWSRCSRGSTASPRWVRHLVALESNAAGTRECVELDADGPRAAHPALLRRGHLALHRRRLLLAGAGLVRADAGRALHLAAASCAPRLARRGVPSHDLPLAAPPSTSRTSATCCASTSASSSTSRLPDLAPGAALLPGRGRRGPPTARLLGPVVLQDGVQVEAGATVVGPGAHRPRARASGATPWWRSAWWARARRWPPGPWRAIALLLAGTRGGARRRRPAYDPLPRPRARFGRAARGQPRPPSAYPRLKAAGRGDAGLVGLLLLSPLLVLLALLVKLDSRGPDPLRRQARGPRRARVPVLQVPDDARGRRRAAARAAAANQMDGPQFKMDHDPRVTRSAASCATISLDELPQLFNVALGQMSLVGPRPSPVPREPDVRALARGAAVGPARHHRPVAGLPARARGRRLPPVDLLRPPLRPSHVAVGRPQDPRRHRHHAGRQGPRAAVLDDPAQQRSRSTHDRVASTAPCSPPPPRPVRPTSCDRLRALAFAGLPRMYSPAQKRFVFRLRRTRTGVVSEGLSRRYTAITLIGLAEEDAAAAPDDDRLATRAREVAREPARRAASVDEPRRRRARRSGRRTAVGHRRPPRRPGTGWRDAPRRRARITRSKWRGRWPRCPWTSEAPAPRAARPRWRAGCSTPRTSVDALPARARRARAARHVACFADLVYPMQALSHLLARDGRPRALDAAARCARHFCDVQGPPASGGGTTTCAPATWSRAIRCTPCTRTRWRRWRCSRWRTPAARRSRARSTGAWSGCGARRSSSGGSLVDDAGRPHLAQGRAARAEQARPLPAGARERRSPAAARARPRRDLPPGRIDYEDRPYHLGWLFYAWPRKRRRASRAAAAR